MLALTDAALARIVIAATRVPVAHRGRWLRRLARALDPLTPLTPDALKRMAGAERRAQGVIILKLKVSETAVAELCVQQQLLSPEYSRQQLEAALIFFLATWRKRVRASERVAKVASPAPAAEQFAA